MGGSSSIRRPRYWTGTGSRFPACMQPGYRWREASAGESRTRREPTAGASARASYSACWLLKVSLRHWPSAGDVFAPCPHGGQYHHDQERGGGDDERKADRARDEDRGVAVGDLQPPPQALSTS